MRAGRARLLIRGVGWAVVTTEGSGSSGALSIAIRSGWRGAAVVVVVVSDTESEAGSEGCMHESACLVT